MAHRPSPADLPCPPPASSLPPSPNQAQTQVFRLANGLTVLVHEDDRFPLASIRLLVRAGSAHESPEQAGISHMLEHMVFKGSPRRGQGQAASDIESVGGELNAATGFDATMYIVDLPADHWVMGLDVLRDMIFNASMDPEELESERQVILSEMDQSEDDPHRRIFKAIQEKIWAGTPYARPIIGFPETVRAMTREDLLAYVQDRYQPADMVLVLCGQVRLEEALEECQRLFGGLTNQAAPRASASLRPILGGSPAQFIVRRGPWQKAYLTLALPIPGLRHAHSVGLDVLAQMLGGDRTSLLYRTFKYEQGLVDTISASTTALNQVGMLTIQAQLDPRNLPALWSGLLDLLAWLTQDSFHPEALERAKLNMEDSLFQAKETLSGLASKLGYFQFHEQTFEAEQTYLHMIRTMDAAQLGQVIQTYIRPEGSVCFIFSPCPEELEASEPQRELRVRWPSRNAPGPSSLRPAAERLQPEIVHLAPGRSVVLLPDHSLPYLALTMSWNGGDLLLSPREQGLSELTARVWTKGTRSKNAIQVQDFLADRAARVGAGAGLGQFYLNAHFPARFSSDMLIFFQELLQEPAWLPEELNRAKQEQCAAIVRTEDSPVGLAFRNTFPFLFPDHPYGYRRSGTPASVTALEQDQVVSFWRRQCDRPWVLAVSGDLDRDAVLETAAALARHQTMAAPTPRPPRWSTQREMLLHLKERSQTHIFAVFPVPGLGAPQTPGLNLLREILAGQSGLLFRELRDAQGLAYSVTAFLWQETLAGFLAFYIGTSPEKEGAALRGFQDVTRGLSRNGAVVSELDRAKNLLWGDYQRGRQRLIARSHEAADNLTRGFALDHSLRLIEQARSTSVSELAALVRDYLQWDKAYLLKVQP